MKAVIIDGYGGPEVLRPGVAPDPEPSGPDVVVTVEACAVEPGLDAMARRGAGSWPIGFPHVLGAATVGRVVAGADAPSAAGPSAPVGTRVAIIPSIACLACPTCAIGAYNACPRRSIIGIHRWGGYAEYVAVPDANVVPIPETLAPTSAAALVVSGVTAWHLIHRRAQVQPSDTVVVMGAAGNVGTVATQLTIARGARVVALVRSQRSAEQVRSSASAAEVIIVGEDHAQARQAVLDATDGHGANVIVDTVGAGLWDVTAAVIAPEGRIVTAGGSSGRDLTIDLPSIYRKNVSLLTASQGTPDDARELFAAAARGAVDLPVAQVFPMSAAEEAHRTLERGGSGKLTLVTD